MPRRHLAAAGLVALAAVAALTACGGASPPEEIDRTMRAWHQALFDGDGERWCAMLTRSARKTLDRDNATLGYPPCVEMVNKGGPRLTDEQARKIRSLRVRAVEMHGKRAVVSVTDSADLGSVGVVNEIGTVLVREEGTWRIESFG